MSSGLTSELELPIEQPVQPLTIMGMELTPLRIGLLIGVSGVLVAGVLGFTQIKPLLENIDKTQKQVNESITRKETLAKQIETLTPVRDQIVKAREVNDQITSLLPTPENAETQLLDLNRLLKISDINLTSFSPQAKAPLTGTVPADVAAQVKQQTTKVAIQGSYNQTMQLMRNIERLKTLLRVSNLTVNAGQQTSPTAPPQLNMSLDLVSYIYDKSVPLATPSPAPQ